MTKKSYIQQIGVALIAGALLANAVHAATPQNNLGKNMREEHASEVSAFVQSLTDLAGKDRNIGEEIRQIAQEQQNQLEQEAQSIEAIEDRGGFKTFLIGTDYKNIGALRSGLVTTQNHIDRLTNALERTTDSQVKTELQTQINLLKSNQQKLETFIDANESKFSLLGWLVKLLNR